MSKLVIKTTRSFWVAVFALLFVCAPAHAALKFPDLANQRVVDDAHILSDTTKADLTAKLKGLEDATKDQLVVVTVPDLQGDDIRDYGYQLGRHWGIGQNGSVKASNGQTYKDNGILLIVAPNEHKVDIEVGYGLEPVMTDGLSGQIIRDSIVPKFKSGDYNGGIVAGTDAIIQQLSLDRGVAIQKAQAATAEDSSATTSRSHGLPVGFIILIVIFFVLFSRGWLPWLLLGSLMGGGRGGGWGGGGGGFGGGGGGGGGFSGGGGSFGGGGASGGW